MFTDVILVGNDIVRFLKMSMPSMFLHLNCQNWFESNQCTVNGYFW